MSTDTLPAVTADTIDDRPPAAPGRILLLSLVAFALGIAISVGLERTRHDEFFGTYHVKAHVVTARREGRLAEWLVKSGAITKIGQPLVRLVDDSLDSALSRKQCEIVSLRAELAQAEAKVAVELEWRLRDVNSDVFETKLKSAYFIKQQYVTTLEGLAIQDLLKETDPIATQELENPALRPLVIPTRKFDERRMRLLVEQEAAQNTQEVAAAQVKLCDERLMQLEKLGARLAEKIRASSGIDVAKARLELAELELKALEAQRPSLFVTADAVGAVGSFQKHVGDVVSPDDVLVRLLDEEQPFVIARVPVTRLVDFPTGKVVTLKFPQGRKGSGRVVDSSLSISNLPDGLAPLDAKTLPIRIVPEASLWPKLPLNAAVEVRLK